MSPEVLAKLLTQTPFQPLRLHLSDGTVFDIRHPEQASIGKNSLRFQIPSPYVGESYATVGMLHIVWVEEILRPV